MASSLALKKLLSSSLLSTSLRLPRTVASGVAPSASRLFNTNAVREYDGDDGDERQLDVDRRSRSPYSRGRDEFFSGCLRSILPNQITKPGPKPNGPTHGVTILRTRPQHRSHPPTRMGRAGDGGRAAAESGHAGAEQRRREGVSGAEHAGDPRRRSEGIGGRIEQEEVLEQD
ncbi:Heat shock 22 kDa protein, mitochondrial [Linum perenne]